MRLTYVVFAICLSMGLQRASLAEGPHRVPAVARLADVVTMSDLQDMSIDVPAPVSISAASCPNGGCDGCASGSCQDAWGSTSCDGGCIGACHCCDQGNRSSVYGAFLYLRPRNADVSYAVPIDGVIAAPAVPIQVGGVGIVDPDYDTGFYAGFNLAWDTCSSFDVRYTMFESSTDDQLDVDPPFVVRSSVLHPSSVNAATDFLIASAQLEIDFDLLDVVYRRRWLSGCGYEVNYVLGGRYAKLEQRFDSEFVANEIENVNTDIDFDGGGVRLGLEGHRRSLRTGLGIFARGYASFVAGRFRADYVQSQNFNPTIVDTDWEGGRVVPILDIELGVGWTSRSERWHISGAYSFSSWFNAVKTEEFIDAVQRNQFKDLNETLTFDGLAASIEYRF